jgi:hypothetical protein
MRQLKIDSTDSEFDQACSESFQPYNVNEITVTVSAQPRVREDGATERTEPVVETTSVVTPGRELLENARAYSKRLDAYKAGHPEFARYGDPDAPIAIAVRDEILRMPNGVEITEFLAFCPDVREALNKLHPLEAVRRVQEMSDDLDWGRVPDDRVTYSTWKTERNLQKAPRKGKHHGGR